MHCPFCRHGDTKVSDSRATEDGSAIRRRRLCPACERKFTTVEQIVLTVATGRSIVPVLTERTASAAQREAEAAGFRVEVTEEETTEVSPGVVFDQDQTAGTALDRGTVINIRVAVAPPEVEPTTPPPTGEPPVVETPTPPPSPPASESPTPDPSATP